MPTIRVTAYQCSRCGHTWLPKGDRPKSARCPHCKSGAWDKPLKLIRHPLTGNERVAGTY